MKQPKRKVPIGGMPNIEPLDADNFYKKARLNLIEILLSKIKADNKKTKILEAGTNNGVNIPTLKKYGEVYATDINEENLPLAKLKNPKEVKCMDLTKLKYSSEKFDIVGIFDVIEHIPDHELAVKNIRKVLKKGGFCLVTVPAFNSLFSSHDEAVEHQRRYNRKELISLFKDFQLIDAGFWNFIPFLPIALIRLAKKKSKATKRDKLTFNKTIDSTLLKFLNFENSLIKKGVKFPFGLTIFAIFRKN